MSSNRFFVIGSLVMDKEKLETERQTQCGSRFCYSASTTRSAIRVCAALNLGLTLTEILVVLDVAVSSGAVFSVDGSEAVARAVGVQQQPPAARTLNHVLTKLEAEAANTAAELPELTPIEDIAVALMSIFDELSDRSIEVAINAAHRKKTGKPNSFIDCKEAVALARQRVGRK